MRCDDKLEKIIDCGIELSNIDIHTYGGWPALFVTGLIILFVVLIVMIAFRKNDWR